MSNNNLLINSTLNVKGAILTVQDMINIHAFYERAKLQEFIYDNTPEDATTEDALKMADRAIEHIDRFKLTETEAIKKASEEFGIPVAV